MKLRLRLSYMLFDEHGNALGSWTDRNEALIELSEFLRMYPEMKDLVALLEYDRRGLPTEVLYPPEEEA